MEIRGRGSGEGGTDGIGDWGNRRGAAVRRDDARGLRDGLGLHLTTCRGNFIGER